MHLTSYDLVHRNVVEVVGDGVGKLEGEADTYLVGGGVGEQPVVISLAASEAVALSVECPARDDGNGGDGL